MPKYSFKGKEVEAHQWFENGDHPKDESYMIFPNLSAESDELPYMREGVVVRRFRHPDISGDTICKDCNEPMHLHGWIDNRRQNNLDIKSTVCPGDWIVEDSVGLFCAVPNQIFQQDYKEIKLLSASEAVYGFGLWLTMRGEKETGMSIENLVELCILFCKANHLPRPAPDWKKGLNFPMHLSFENQKG